MATTINRVIVKSGVWSVESSGGLIDFGALLRFVWVTDFKMPRSPAVDWVRKAMPAGG